MKLQSSMSRLDGGGDRRIVTRDDSSRKLFGNNWVRIALVSSTVAVRNGTIIGRYATACVAV